MASENVIRVYLVNGESRSLRVDEGTDSVDVIRFILRRLHVNMDYSTKLFGLQLKHVHSSEHYWLQAGYTIYELVDQYCTTKPLDEWKFLLRIRVLPKTAQHLQSQDPVAFQYFYDQVLHMYLEDDGMLIDTEIAIKLGCLELRRFYKDMPQIALKKKENFSILEREVGLEKFFRQSLLSSLPKKKLRTMVVNIFEQFENLSMEGCIFQFFNLLAKQYPLDVEQFSNCAIGERQDGVSHDLTCDIFVGPNCEVEYRSEKGERRFLMAFNDIHDISYEPELITRGRIVIELKPNSQTVVIRTAVLINAIHLATLINAYCMVYSSSPHSRISGGRKRGSNASRLSSLYNTFDELRPPIPTPAFDGAHPDDYAEVKEQRTVMSHIGAYIQPRDVVVGERIGEGQFGDVHKGQLFPRTTEEQLVAIKTCKPEASDAERAKFLEEAAIMAKFNHPHIIKLFGVMSHESTTYIVMELAQVGQLRRYLMTEGAHIGKVMLIQYIMQLCSAMVYLESKNFVHRDIAARNVLLATPEHVKLADFGLSRRLEDTDYYVASKGKLPIKWMAPESINFRKFTGLSDVWMFGVCCWEILMKGVKPFVGVKNDEVINMIELGQRLPYPPDCPPALFELLNQCWQYDPQERPTFSQIEQSLIEIMDQEKKQDPFQKKISGLVRPDPSAPEKPRWDSHSINRMPSDPAINRRSGLGSDVDAPPPPPPRRPDELKRDTSTSPVGNIPWTNSPGSKLGIRPPEPLPRPAPTILPYSVTTITHREPTYAPPETTIPPPSILHSNSDRAGSAERVEYYTVPPEDGGHNRPSVGRQYSSSRSPTVENLQPLEPTQRELDEFDDENDEMLKQTTCVVKAVFELSNKVPISRPADYVDLVKNVGMSIRELFSKGEALLQTLPPEAHNEITMAQKVLSSDVNRLVEAMKDAQKHYQTFLEQEYQKQMLKAAHIIAVNAKQLLDAVNNARRTKLR